MQPFWLDAMERFLRPGFIARPKVEQTEAKRGRPKVKAAEGSLDLGVKRPRSCSSNQKLVDAQRILELERKVALLQASVDEGSAVDDKMERVLTLHAQCEDENKKLRERLFKRKKSSFDTPI